MKHPSSARAKNVVAFENWTYEVNLWRLPAQPGDPSAGDPPRRVTQTADQWNFEPHIAPGEAAKSDVIQKLNPPQRFPILRFHDHVRVIALKRVMHEPEVPAFTRTSE